tara:strand:- start:98 stop:436 length:339 start_codon:yes stop_codon:yes gene_type:complete
MAHFAELDENNIVLRVIVVNDAHEADGENWCHNFAGGVWKQTSYNNNIRYNYAGIGYTYDAAADAFYSTQPYASWTLDAVYIWQPPTPRPDDGEVYFWDEPTLSWMIEEQNA